MSKIIRATVSSNSCDDKYARVKITKEGFWENSPLVCSLGGIPLKKGDIVFVDISAGLHNPFILGRATHSLNKFHAQSEGSVLFESSDGNSWTFASVCKDDFKILNSSNVSVEINSSNIVIKTPGTIKFQDGTLISKGQTTVPATNGPYCAILKCPYTGSTHVGHTVNLE